MELFRGNFRKDRAVHIPEVLPELSSRRVLVMEFVEGVLLSDPEGLARAKVDTRRIAAVGVRYVLAQIFQHGVYNADPHPANFIVRPDGVLAPVDFGMVGVLNEDVRQALVGLLQAFVNRDPARLLRVFAGLDLLEEGASQGELADDLGRLINYYSHMPVSQLEVARVFGDLYSVVRRYHIALPVDLALTLKVLVTLESLGKRLYPKFDFLLRGPPLRAEGAGAPPAGVGEPRAPVRAGGGDRPPGPRPALRGLRPIEESPHRQAQAPPGPGGPGGRGARDRPLGQPPVLRRGDRRDPDRLLVRGPLRGGPPSSGCRSWA